MSTVQLSVLGAEGFVPKTVSVRKDGRRQWRGNGHREKGHRRLHLCGIYRGYVASRSKLIDPDEVV